MAPPTVFMCVLAVILQISCNPVPVVKYDVIVVGLGPSGTAAATTLAKAGKKVVALEAQARIGGRVKTIEWGKGTVEEGAEWIHGTTNSTTYRLVRENNVITLPQQYTLTVLRSDGTQYDPKVVKDLLEFALAWQDDRPEKPEPLGKFITRRTQKYVAEKYPAVLNDTDFLNEFYHFVDLEIQEDESCNSWNDVTTSSRLTELKGNQNISWHKYGYKTLFQILLNCYNNGPGIPNLDIKLSTEVTNIEWSPDTPREVVVTTAGGNTYIAPHVIVTPSLGVLKAKYKTLFTPELPNEKIEAIHNISFGICDKVIIRFGKNWWGGTYGRLVFIWKGVDRKKLSKEDWWLYGTEGLYPSMSANDTVTSWFCGERAKKVEATSNNVLQTKIMALIRRFAGKEYNIPEPLEITKSTWYSNPFVRGSYSFDSISPPTHHDSRAHLATPLTDADGVARVLFAGEATESTHFSTVHGALDTGFREAKRLLLHQ